MSSVEPPNAKAGPSKRSRDNDMDMSDGDDTAGAGHSTTVNGNDEVKSKVSKTKKKRRTQAPGIIYISRVPPGMTPQKVRHLMSRWGEVGKVYAQRKDAATNSQDPKKKTRHQQANFTEAWVEFLDKEVAKTVARMLNAEVIGGKKGDRWRDDIWTMKYLSGFKWEMLGEQVAYERQAHQSRLRAEINRSKTEQGEYLRNVELARVLEKRRVKKAATEAGGGSTASAKPSVSTSSTKTEGGEKKERFRQRQVVDRAKGLEGKGMSDVLSSVFG